MNTKTALNAYNRLASMMDSIYSAAESYGSPHSAILEKLKEKVNGDPQYMKAPGWVCTRLQERSSMRLAEIYRYKVIWAFEANGRIKLWDELTDEERQQFITENKTGAHYWLRVVTDGGKWQSRDANGEHMITRYEITGNKF